MTKRIFALLLSVVMVCSAMIFTTAYAEGEPYYVTHEIKTTEAGTTLTAKVYLRGVVGTSGNLALALVDEGLEFEPVSDKLEETVVAAGVVVVTDFGVADEVDLAKVGRVAFTWHVPVDEEDGTQHVDASEEDVLIATITYKLSADGDISVLGSADNTTKALFAELTPTNISDLPHFVGYPARVMTKDSKFVDGVVVEDFKVLDATTKASSNSLTIGWEKDNDSEYEFVRIDLVKVNGEGSDDELVGSVIVPMQNGSYKWPELENGQKYVATITPVNTFNDEADGEITESGVPSQVEGTPKKSSSVTVSGGSTTTKYDVEFTIGEGSFEDDKKSVIVEVERNGKLDKNKLPEISAPAGKKFVGWTADGETIIDFDTYKITGDVKLTPVFEDDADADKAYHNAYINGYEDGTVKPGANIKRAEAAAIIAKVSADFNANLEYAHEFNDVKTGDWFEAYVGYCAANEIITGYADGTFRPNEYITRAEFTVMISRMLTLELTAEGSFPDTADHWANKYVMALKAAGIVDGYTDGTFKPENDITRAEAVKIVNRALDRAPSEEKLEQYIDGKGCPFKDLAEDFWGFYDIIEASVPHEIVDCHE